MRVKPEQLSRCLQDPPAPCYAFFSDEPFFLIEAERLLRAAAARAGYAQTDVLTAEPGFDFKLLENERQSMSLFAERRLLILRLNAQKPGEAGGKVLKTWAESPPADVLLLISGVRPDGAAQKSAWFRALEERGVVTIFYPPELRQWPQWVAQRMQKAGLRADEAALALLAERSEGNLLACVQAIDMLALLCPERTVALADVLSAIGDSAHFSVFELSQVALQGDAGHALRILEHLRLEGIEPVLVLWALSRDLRLLLALQGRAASPVELWRENKIFGTHQDLLLKAARARAQADVMAGLMLCARIDAAIKGHDTLPVWPALADLALQVAGKTVHHSDLA